MGTGTVIAMGTATTITAPTAPCRPTAPTATGPTPSTTSTASRTSRGHARVAPVGREQQWPHGPAARGRGGRLRSVAQPLGRLDAVHQGHVAIHHDQVWPLGGGPGERLAAVADVGDLVAITLQGGLDHAGDVGIVV